MQYNKVNTQKNTNVWTYCIVLHVDFGYCVPFPNQMYSFLHFARCQLKTERTDALAKAAEEAAAARRPARKSAEDESKPKVFKSGVGKYINPHLQ